MKDREGVSRKVVLCDSIQKENNMGGNLLFIDQF